MKETFSDVLQAFVDNELEQLHTTIPGKISTYDPDTRTAEVLPLVRLKTAKGIDIEMPAVSNVPVVFPCSSEFSLIWPLKPGDGCLLMFAEVGIGNYLSSTGEEPVNADDTTRHTLTDAICIPGLYPTIGIPQSNATITIDAQGLYEIKNQVANLGTLISDLLTEIQNIQTVGSPTQHVLSPTSIAGFLELQSQFATLLK